MPSRTDVAEDQHLEPALPEPQDGAYGKWGYDPTGLNTNNRGCFCCAGRPKEVRNASNGHQVWETADMTWWDFQRRRWHTLWLMKTIYYRLKRVEADTEGMPDGDEQNDMWTSVHTLNAREMREHAESAKGLFIKAGQYMSTMAGVLPDVYCEEFMVLTDHLPVSTIEEVYRVIQRDFKKPPKEIFEWIEETPIASASIAQVHKARLKNSGEIVAVKVQHDGVDRVFLEDVSTLSAVAEQVCWWYPDLDFRKFTEEWRESLPKELDFTQERRAIDRASSVLKKHDCRVIVPKVHKKFAGQHVFVMDFIEATPVMALGDDKFCQENGVNKHKVLETLLHAFGIMAFKDGLFHADPHAGNVRIILDKTACGGATPVLFDWGLFREISDHERMGLCKLFHALANFDLTGFFNVLDVLGFSIREEMMTDDFRREFIEKARGLLKDTVSRQKTRENVRHDMMEYKERLQKAAGQGAKASISPIYFLEEFPRCIIFFMRMMQILRGLCVSVNADGVPLLQIFSRYATEALLEGSRKPSIVSRLQIFAGREVKNRSCPIEGANTAKIETAPIATLEKMVQSSLDQLLKSKRVVGGQVAVIQNGRLVCDVAAGTLSTIDARPVESGTRFPMMGMSAGIAVLALLRTLRRLDLSSPAEALQTPLSRIWPEFNAGRAQSLTLAHLLSHSLGIQDAFPKNFAPRHLDDVQTVAQHFEQALDIEVREPRYAYLLQAFLLAKLGDCLAGKDSLLHWLGSELGPLGLDVAAPAGRGGEASVCRELPELARVSMQEVSAGRERRKQARVEDPQGEAQTPSDSASQTILEQLKQSLLEALQKDPLAFDPLQANTGHGGLFRAGLSLGASARGLATMLSSEKLQTDLQELRALELAGMDGTAVGWMLTGGAPQWTAGGLQVLELSGFGRKKLLANRQGGYGVVCGFGPCVAHFPDLATGGVTVAIMVNDVLRGREVAAELMTQVLSKYGYAPAWTSVPLRVMVDAVRMSKSQPTQSLIASMGGIKALQRGLGQQPEQRTPSRCGGCTGGLHKATRDASGSSGDTQRRHGLLHRLGTWSSRACGGRARSRTAGANPLVRSPSFREEEG